jgi:hypothetical protein
MAALLQFERIGDDIFGQLIQGEYEGRNPKRKRPVVLPRQTRPVRAERSRGAPALTPHDFGGDERGFFCISHSQPRRTGRRGLFHHFGR